MGPRAPVPALTIRRQRRGAHRNAQHACVHAHAHVHAEWQGSRGSVNARQRTGLPSQQCAADQQRQSICAPTCSALHADTICAPGRQASGASGSAPRLVRPWARFRRAAPSPAVVPADQHMRRASIREGGGFLLVQRRYGCGGMTQTGAHATQRRMAGVVQHERLTRRSALALQPHGASHRKAAIDFFF